MPSRSARLTSSSWYRGSDPWGRKSAPCDGVIDKELPVGEVALARRAFEFRSLASDEMDMGIFPYLFLCSRNPC
jgi:hypothetical protein